MPQGEFVWYQLDTSDLEGAKAFYAKVVGWDLRPVEGDEAHGYTLLGVGETAIGGMSRLPDEAAAAGAKPGWIGYIGVDDVDAAAESVAAKGGAIRRPPEDMGPYGRFAVATDPQGAPFILFKGTGEGPPSTPMDAPGACAWRELLAADGPSAFDFYAAVFGWTKGEAMDMGPMGVYQLFNTGGDQSVGGIMTRPPGVPAPYWTYYFTVDGIDAAVARLTDAGGKVVNGPMEVPGGMWVLNGLDPQGCLFSLLGPKG